jgi:hypothetical protein
MIQYCLCGCLSTLARVGAVPYHKYHTYKEKGQLKNLKNGEKNEYKLLTAKINSEDLEDR